MYFDKQVVKIILNRNIYIVEKIYRNLGYEYLFELNINVYLNFLEVK